MKNAAKLVKSNFKALKKTVERLVDTQVLVGVPAEKTPRKEDGPNNATLLYVHENGSPAANVPARPTLGPGVEAVKEQIAETLGSAAKKAVKGEAQTDKDFHRVGLLAVSSVRAQFANLSPPLKRSTILNRFRSRGTAKRRKSEEEFVQAVSEGIPVEAAQQAAGIQPLMNTGQLRNAINYVIRKG